MLWTSDSILKNAGLLVDAADAAHCRALPRTAAHDRKRFNISGYVYR
jgi:hypothetical protein